MKITHTPGERNFNGFYHAILTEAYEKAREISFRGWKSGQGNGCLIFYRGEDYDCVALPSDTPFEIDDSLKTIFKNMNLDYPMSTDEKTSTTKLDSNELCRHIVWITKILNENGIEFDHDIEEWERIKMEAGIGA